MENFRGVKIALIYEDQILVYLRDNKPGLNFANMWDLFGGGREGNETPFECVSRELQEEWGITISEDSIVWQRIYPGMIDPETRAYFMVAALDKETIDSIVFGDEGQEWKLMPIAEFISSDTAVPKLQERLKDYLHEVKQ